MISFVFQMVTWASSVGNSVQGGRWETLRPLGYSIIEEGLDEVSGVEKDFLDIKEALVTEDEWQVW